MKFGTAWKGVFIFTFLIASATQASASTLSTGEIINAINQERTSRGLSTLNTNSALTQAAENRSVVLANAGYITHVTAPSGTPWPEISQVGYQYSLAGENLALGIETTSELVARWMASPTHRENILEGKFEDIGIGITLGQYEGRVVSYVVSYYGQKKTGVAKASVAPANPVISSASVSAPVRAPKASPKLSQKSVTPSNSPVLSSKYTVETLPEATPVSVPSNSDEEEVRIVDRIIAFFGSHLRNLKMRFGLL